MVISHSHVKLPESNWEPRHGHLFSNDGVMGIKVRSLHLLLLPAVFGAVAAIGPLGRVTMGNPWTNISGYEGEET